MSIGNRIKEARKAIGLTQDAFAEKTGIPIDTLRKYEGDKSQPGAAAMTGIARSGINTHWLLTGEGSILIEDQLRAIQTDAYATHSPTVLTAHSECGEYGANEDFGYISIPFYDGVRVSAGPGAVVESELASKAIRFNEVWLRNELGVNPANLGLAMVEGDSMEPTFRSGGLVLFDQSVKRLCREGFYILRSGDMVIVKRVRALLGGGIEIISDNPAYERFVLTPEELEAANFAVLGRVVWGDRRF